MILSDVIVQRVPDKPVFIYDGECRFCLAWVARWQAQVGDAVQVVAAPDPRFSEIPDATYDRSSVFVDVDGKVYIGAEAIFRMLNCASAKSLCFLAYRRLPGFGPTAEWIYRQIAARRSHISRITRWLAWNRQS